VLLPEVVPDQRRDVAGKRQWKDKQYTIDTPSDDVLGIERHRHHKPYRRMKGNVDHRPHDIEAQQREKAIIRDVQAIEKHSTEIIQADEGRGCPAEMLCPKIQQ